MSDENPFVFTDDEDRAREARVAAARSARAAKRAKDRAAARKPPPEGFVTNRQLCLASAVISALPAFLLGIMPTVLNIVGEQMWPAVFKVPGRQPERWLLHGSGFFCALFLFANLLSVFRRCGQRDTGRTDGSGHPIITAVEINCPKCGVQWRWYQFPAFHSNYQCPRCGTVRCLLLGNFDPTFPFHVIPQFLCAIVGYAGLVYLLL